MPSWQTILDRMFRALLILVILLNLLLIFNVKIRIKINYNSLNDLPADDDVCFKLRKLIGKMLKIIFKSLLKYLKPLQGGTLFNRHEFYTLLIIYYTKLLTVNTCLIDQNLKKIYREERAFYGVRVYQNQWTFLAYTVVFKSLKFLIFFGLAVNVISSSANGSLLAINAVRPYLMPKQLQNIFWQFWSYTFF